MFQRKASKSWGQGRREGFNHGGGDRPRPRLFQAVCDQCESPCQVPFRPSGQKPVLCSNCFEKQDNRHSGGSNFEQSRHFKNTSHEYSSPSKNQDEMIKQLKTLNTKMDQLLEIMGNQSEKEEI
ncbi:hypothetical protein CO172_01390 [Candidatus Uhrbacteria bacterium CG_4_9_14_3_um_filter_36_7]|uniref:CxxC-x17-CxxC domain-containing protein n=1 Tax=Candidatus Uhrbacteria bacterium CG_4_9_14_3_um_filter_36_7 TaxID=1975033 RepID=A0A2M7XHV8_9BACT|nr:MAG: hypothetical protein CO172_01390 [Candidatus Uhrbacteria bacterium CG_4_9_14_3_um_filter_36_7]